MSGKEKIHNVLFILSGVLILVLKQCFINIEIVYNYAGNFSVSFATYFLISFNADYWKKNKLITAVIALLIVELFELTDGFGIMQNVFDAYDLIANLAGVGLALALDWLFLINKSG